MRANPTLRIKLLSIGVIVVTLICVIRLYFLQIVRNDTYQELADHQYMTQGQNSFDRGSIFFEDKNGTQVLAASLRTGFLMAINPRLVKDIEGTYATINASIPIDRDMFFQKANKKTDPYEEIARQIPEDVAQPVMDANLPGVMFYKDYWRFYPGNTMAAQTLGFVAFKGNNLEGRYGLESQYQSVLLRNKKSTYVNSFAELFSDIKGLVSTDDTTEGNVVTTIEPTVEQFLEDQLKKTNDKWSSSLTGGIVINPKTGEIYAMSTYPNFNLNSFQTEKNVGIYSNPLVEHVYEMGSIVKPLTMAAGLDAGVITPSTTYNDTGTMTVDGKKISNYDGRARGITSMQEILNQSLNLGVSFIARKLGNDRFSDYMYAYGIGERTGIDLPNEAKGLVDNLKSPREVEHDTASFGQGIALSPVAITRALAVLANGGKLISPHVVKEIDYTNGRVQTMPINPGVQVIKKETADTITSMLTTVVDKALLEGKVKQEHYTIAAKTGTAQIARETGGGYYTDRYLHSFFGYFPAKDPEFLVFMYTVYPKGVDYASHTLTDPFINLTKFLISYYQLPPDR